MFVPDCNNFREKITHWCQPMIKFAKAVEVSEALSPQRLQTTSVPSMHACLMT